MVIRQFLDDGSSPTTFTDYRSAQVVIVPVPLEKTVSYLSGTRLGPRRILDASAQVELYEPEFASSPYETGIHTTGSFPCNGRLPLVLEQLTRYTGSLLDDGKTPVLLGGEHSLTFASVAACFKRRPGIGVLHLDAHADLREEYSGTRLSHACVMCRVAELHIPVVSVGVRALSAEEAKTAEHHSIRLFGAWQYGTNGYPWAEIVDALPEEIYLSIDLDVFDPAYVPAVGTPEPGGINWFDALALLRSLAGSGKTVIGMDLVELCPHRHSVISDFFAARLLYRMIGHLFPA